MLARSTKIHHPMGNTLETPILVPSFSSKGFGVNKGGESEIKGIFKVASEYMTDTMLVSAYDLHYGHLDKIQSAITEVTIVDSGGYEISDTQDLSAVYRQPVDPEDWTEVELKAVLDNWPKGVPAVFVTYDKPDRRLSLSRQVENGRRLFRDYPDQLHTLLIKPETETQDYVQVKNVIAGIEELRGFNIIGFTEKELGNSILKRMLNIASIRLCMDDAKIPAPIHIYGSLDPITSALYFLAGAEIFDGLTWLRYGYMDGLACYSHNYGARKVGIDRKDDFIKAKTIQDNLGYLNELSNQMKKFLLDGDFNKFGANAEILRNSFELLRTKNARVS